MSRMLPMALLLALVPFVQQQVDARHVSGARDEALYLWSGDQIRRLAPGYSSVLADLYWLRTVQYYGRQAAFEKGREYPLLGPLLDITVTLDPRMEIAYRYGAIFLSETPPGGAGRPQDGTALLERGVAAQPENWHLRQDLGFYHFLFLHDSRKAAEVLDQASELPDAPFWLRSLAADVLLKGGDRTTSRRIWEKLYSQSEGSIRDNSRLQLAILDALDESDRLSEVVARFASRMGHPPQSLMDLVSAGFLRAPPVDSTGVPFEYDPTTGRVSISRRSGLWRPT